eukprot:TRINITY_DN70450_c0_g1_i1.p1 TRINITY_DN70450_c0_g1~~TRINITY_DN70450_c0_g1_i1.p1  ORF type:complete len:203 (+),score=41.09 TRINITY_DN70450_c0_g1_i1:217-825(+)
MAGRGDLKIILLGDSLVGKSKLVERYLMEGFMPQQLSTHGLTLFRLEKERDGKKLKIDFWDTAGQERYNNVHRSYYFGAHCCILVFDVQKQQSYKNLGKWYEELCSARPGIPCLVAANKIDTNPSVISVEFKFATKHKFPLHYVSALEGTNVVRMFEQAIDLAMECPKDYVTEVTDLLREIATEEPDEPKEDTAPKADAETK